MQEAVKNQKQGYTQIWKLTHTHSTNRKHKAYSKHCQNTTIFPLSLFLHTCAAYHKHLQLPAWRFFLVGEDAVALCRACQECRKARVPSSIAHSRGEELIHKCTSLLPTVLNAPEPPNISGSQWAPNAYSGNWLDNCPTFLGSPLKLPVLNPCLLLGELESLQLSFPFSEEMSPGIDTKSSFNTTVLKLLTQ